MVINLSVIAPNLEKHDDGIWYAPQASDVSYPKGFHQRCYEFEAQSFWFNHRNRCIIAAIRAFPPDGAVFDIGGGNGFVTRAMRESGIDAVLVEPGRDGVRFARERGVEPIICGTLQDAGFRPSTLPAAGLFDVIEHIEDDGEFLHQLHGLMRKGGRVYITVPAYMLLWSFDDECGGHFRRYSVSSLSKTLAGAGFQLDYATYFFFYLPLPIFLVRTLPSRLKVRRKLNENQVRTEHTGGGVFQLILKRLLAGEPDRITRGQSIICGGSCLAVARTA